MTAGIDFQRGLNHIRNPLYRRFEHRLAPRRVGFFGITDGPVIGATPEVSGPEEAFE